MHQEVLLTLTCAAFLVSSGQMCPFASHSVNNEAWPVFKSKTVNPPKFHTHHVYLTHLLFVVGAQSILMACLEHQNLQSKEQLHEVYIYAQTLKVLKLSPLSDKIKWINNPKLCWFPCSVWRPGPWRLRTGPSPLRCSETRMIYCK